MTRPVVVVGAGPVGASAAILLGQRGVPVVVLDRWSEVYPQPRAVHLDDEVHRLLAHLGVAEEFARISRPAAGLRLVDRDLRVLGEFSREGVSDTNGYHRANMYDQPELEALLRARIGTLDAVTFRGGLEVTDVETAPHGTARVHVRRLDSGAEEVVEASYVLGCDGANSVVRGAVGATLEDLDFEQRWLVIDVETSVDLGQWEGVQQVCDSQRAATYMRIGPTRYRWELQRLDGETHEQYATIEALGPLLRPWTAGVDPADLRVLRVASYTFRAALADRWRRGPVFLLGDAAHLTPPFIGQGLGAGVRDAANLTWKLAGVLSGELDTSALDTYEVERRAHARELVLLARRVGVAMTSGGRLGDTVRRVAVPAVNLVPEIRRQVSDSSTPPLVASDLVAPAGRLRRRDPLAGTLVPNVVSSSGRGLARLDDLLGGRWALVTSHPVAPSDRSRLDGLGVVVVDAAGGPLRAWLEGGRAVAAAVRPDGAVMTSAASVPVAVAALLGTLRPTRDDTSTAPGAGPTTARSDAVPPSAPVLA